MPRHNTQVDDDIVFEDLHGVPEDDLQTVEVDLDADDKADGITRKARTSSDEGRTTDEDDDGIDYGPRRGTDDDDDDDDGDDDEAGDRDRFSKKFQARLKREQRQKRRERSRADAAEAENARLRKELKRAGKKGDDGADARLTQQIESVEADLEQAIEAGDSKKQVRLSSQLTDLKAERIAAKYTRADDDGDDQDDDEGTRQQPRNELTEDWLDKHGDWYGQRGYARLTRLAKRIDQELFAEGYDPRDEEYYEELDSRLKEKEPTLFDKDGNPDPDGMDARKSRRRRDPSEDREDKRRRSIVDGADDASRDSQRRTPRDSNRVELGPEEFRNMRRFGLDPNNADHVKEYALNKRQADLEARNG